MKQVVGETVANEKKQASELPLVAVVDDDDLFRRSILRLLRLSGLRAEGFASAEAFLHSELLGQTACLLQDVRMPGMGGLELQQRLTNCGERIPIIFLSARASEEEEKRALQAGAACFLRKPVNKEALLKAIHSVLESPRRNNHRPSKEEL